MPISEEVFDRAEQVVESGVTAATFCAQSGMKALPTHAALIDSLRDENLNADAVLDLFGVALMLIVKARYEAEQAREG